MAQDMPKVNMAKEFASLNTSDQHFVKKLEAINKERADTIRRVRSRNKYTIGALAAFVVGIYGYSLYAVQQEKFLDFETVPEKKSDS